MNATGRRRLFAHLTTACAVALGLAFAFGPPAAIGPASAAEKPDTPNEEERGETVGTFRTTEVVVRLFAPVTSGDVTVARHSAPRFPLALARPAAKPGGPVAFRLRC